MAKLLFIVAALTILQVYIEAAPSIGNPPTQSEELSQIAEAEPKLDNEAELPKEVSEDEKVNDDNDRSSQVQRQKRFYNYFNFGFSPYGPYPEFVSRDDFQDAGAYGTEYSLSQIFRRVQELLQNYTRQQSLYPPAPRIPVTSYIPVLYISRGGCGCTSDDDRHSDSENTGNDITSAPPISTPPIITTAQPISPAIDNVPIDPTPTDDSNKPSLDFPTRSQTSDDDDDDDDQDGARPISFVPIMPKTPLSRPAPPVEHGTVEGGDENGLRDVPAASGTPPPVYNSVAQEPSFQENPRPSLCDGAVLTCCHRSEATYSCFAAQGCPDPTPYGSPCDANVILDVVRKFESYYANRQG